MKAAGFLGCCSPCYLECSVEPAFFPLRGAWGGRFRRRRERAPPFIRELRRIAAGQAGLRRKGFPQPLFVFLCQVAAHTAPTAAVNGRRPGQIFTNGIFDHSPCGSFIGVESVWGEAASSISARTRSFPGRANFWRKRVGVHVRRGQDEVLEFVADRTPLSTKERGPVVWCRISCSGRCHC